MIYINITTSKQGTKMQRIFVDVREPYEFKKGHIKDAINIPPIEIMQGAKSLSKFDKDTEIVLYCLSGSRSNVSIRILSDMGYQNLVNGVNKEHVASRYNLEITRP